MDRFEILKNEKINVGNIHKQRMNITTKVKGKPLKQKDIKKIVKLIHDKFVEEKDTEPKYLFVESQY